MAPTKKPRSRFKSGDRFETRVKYSAIQNEIDIESEDDEEGRDAVDSELTGNFSRNRSAKRNSKYFKSFNFDRFSIDKGF